MKILFFLLILSATPVQAECEVPHVLGIIRPGAQWILSGDTYDGLRWMDTKQQKPTRSEYDLARASCVTRMEARRLAKIQARYDVKLSTKTAAQRISALLLLLDLDQ